LPPAAEGGVGAPRRSRNWGQAANLDKIRHGLVIFRPIAGEEVELVGGAGAAFTARVQRLRMSNPTHPWQCGLDRPITEQEVR
jgi:hypothetical protein